MSYETKELTGSLFVNDNKVEGTRQPDFTGNVKIEGKLWRIAGWNTESRGGIEYISLKVTDPEEFKRQQERTAAPAGSSRFPGRDRPTPPTRRMSPEEFEKQRAAMRQQTRPSLPDDIDDDDIPF